MKNLLLFFFLSPFFSLSQTYNVQTTDALGNINTIKVTKESNPYENIKVNETSEDSAIFIGGSNFVVADLLLLQKTANTPWK